MEFWFEFASTYSYLACARLAGPEAPSDIAVRWKPFLLGPAFAEQGWATSPFLIYPAKGRYMWRDMERLCDQAGLPFRRPKIFPQHSVAAARVACLGQGQAWLPAFALSVYQANFAEGEDISHPEVLRDRLGHLGLDGASLLEESVTPENKASLRRNTEQALARGLFEAPSFLVGDEMFWGADRLDHAVSWARKAE